MTISLSTIQGFFVRSLFLSLGLITVIHSLSFFCGPKQSFPSFSCLVIFVLSEEKRTKISHEREMVKSFFCCLRIFLFSIDYWIFDFLWILLCKFILFHFSFLLSEKRRERENNADGLCCRKEDGRKKFGPFKWEEEERSSVGACSWCFS